MAVSSKRTSVANKNGVVIRRGTPFDMEAIDAIRRPFYKGEPLNSDPRILWLIAERNGKIVAVGGLLEQEGVTYVVDCYGVEARGWRDLRQHIERSADIDGRDLACWVELDNKNHKYFEKTGWTDRMVLMTRKPQKVK